ncbi:hypothetical protein KY361_05840 [Candidatus Woesearchaeota archaeon]|nr:hypothetical protein [Candidatus Woesearchaeota archaeon]
MGSLADALRGEQPEKPEKPEKKPEESEETKKSEERPEETEKSLVDFALEKGNEILIELRGREDNPDALYKPAHREDSRDPAKVTKSLFVIGKSHPNHQLALFMLSKDRSGLKGVERLVRFQDYERIGDRKYRSRDGSTLEFIKDPKGLVARIVYSQEQPFARDRYCGRFVQYLTELRNAVMQAELSVTELLRAADRELISILAKRSEGLEEDDDSFVYQPHTLVDNPDRSKVTKGLEVNGGYLRNVQLMGGFADVYQVMITAFSKEIEEISRIRDAVKDKGCKEVEKGVIPEVEGVGEIFYQGEELKLKFYKEPTLMLAFGEKDRFYTATLIHRQPNPITNTDYVRILEGLRGWFLYLLGESTEDGCEQELLDMDNYELPIKQEVTVGEKYKSHLKVEEIGGQIRVKLTVVYEEGTLTETAIKCYANQFESKGYSVRPMNDRLVLRRNLQPGQTPEESYGKVMGVLSEASDIMAGPES